MSLNPHIASLLETWGPVGDLPTPGDLPVPRFTREELSGLTNRERGDVLRILRHGAGLTQVAAAEAMGYSAQTIQKVEIGYIKGSDRLLLRAQEVLSGLPAATPAPPGPAAAVARLEVQVVSLLCEVRRLREAIETKSVAGEPENTQ